MGTPLYHATNRIQTADTQNGAFFLWTDYGEMHTLGMILFAEQLDFNPNLAVSAVQTFAEAWWANPDFLLLVFTHGWLFTFHSHATSNIKWLNQCHQLPMSFLYFGDVTVVQNAEITLLISTYQMFITFSMTDSCHPSTSSYQCCSPCHIHSSRQTCLKWPPLQETQLVFVYREVHNTCGILQRINNLC